MKPFIFSIVGSILNVNIAAVVGIFSELYAIYTEALDSVTITQMTKSRNYRTGLPGDIYRVICCVQFAETLRKAILNSQYSEFAEMVPPPTPRRY